MIRLATAVLLLLPASSMSVATRTVAEIGSAESHRGVAGKIARYLGRVNFCSLLVLIVLTAIPYGTNRVWTHMAFAAVVFAITVLWLTEGLISSYWGIRDYKIYLPLVILIVFAYIQTLPLFGQSEMKAARAISAAPYDTRLFIIKFTALTLFLILLRRYVNSRTRIQALLYTIVGVAIASAIFGIARQTIQSEGTDFLLPLQAGKGYAQFINKNHFALLMTMGFGLLLGIIARGGAGRERIFLYLAMMIPLWGALALSNSRGGILALIGQLVFALLIMGDVRANSPGSEKQGGLKVLLKKISRSVAFRILLAATLAVVMFLGLLWMGGERLAANFETTRQEFVNEEDQSRVRARRVDFWRSTWELIKEHPVAGAGFGAYWVAIGTHHDASGVKAPQEAHNDYLELVASGGIIGLALGIWFLVMLTNRVRRQFRSSDSFRRAACAGAVVALVGAAIHSFFDFGLHLIFNAVVCLGLIAIATVDFDSVVERESKSESYKEGAV